MGGDSSQPKQPQIIQNNAEQQMQDSPCPEFDGIPAIEPFIKRHLMMEQFPNELYFQSGKLADAYKLTKTYFRGISYHLNQNEEAIAKAIRKTLGEYIELSKLLEKRRVELDSQLSKLLQNFRGLNDEIKSTVNALTQVIEKADRIAQSIDPEMPSFATFCSQ